jgi:hypothetical protein
MAIALARLGMFGEAREVYLRCIDRDPAMAFRANLDPELSDIIRPGEDRH